MCVFFPFFFLGLCIVITAIWYGHTSIDTRRDRRDVVVHDASPLQDLSRNEFLLGTWEHGTGDDLLLDHLLDDLTIVLPLVIVVFFDEQFVCLRSR